MVHDQPSRKRLAEGPVTGDVDEDAMGNQGIHDCTVGRGWQVT